MQTGKKISESNSAVIRRVEDGCVLSRKNPKYACAYMYRKAHTYEEDIQNLSLVFLIVSAKKLKPLKYHWYS